MNEETLQTKRHQIRTHHHHTVKLSKKTRNERFKRSMSLNQLNNSTKEEIKPRMLKLQSLEKSMVQIAQALSTPDVLEVTQTDRGQDRVNSIKSTMKTGHSDRKLDSRWHKLTRALKEQKNSNKLKEVAILQLKNECDQLKEALRNSFNHHKSGSFKFDLNEEAVKSSLEIEEKKALVKSLRLSLDSCHMSENIDRQIARAELEYKLGNEELALIDLQQKYQEMLEKTLQISRRKKIPHKQINSVYEYVEGEYSKGNIVTINTTEIPMNFSPKENLYENFGFSIENDDGGLTVNSIDQNRITELELNIGDRLLEVNEVNIMEYSQEEFHSMIEASYPKSLKIVYARNQDEMKKMKHLEVFKKEMSDVVSKLDHRIVENEEISYKYEKLHRAKSSLEKMNRKQKQRIRYLEDKINHMVAGWRDLRLALDEQLTDNSDDVTRDCHESNGLEPDDRISINVSTKNPKKSENSVENNMDILKNGLDKLSVHKILNKVHENNIDDDCWC